MKSKEKENVPIPNYASNNDEFKLALEEAKQEWKDAYEKFVVTPEGTEKNLKLRDDINEEDEKNVEATRRKQFAKIE